MMLDCPFRISFKWDAKKETYLLNERKTIWNHNHKLNYKGLTKVLMKDIKTYVASEQIKKTHTPALSREKMLSYIKGRENGELIDLPYHLCSYIHYTNKKKIYGLSDEDADNLHELFLKIKEDMPGSLLQFQQKD